ncbi:hypothetical protein HUJ04_012535 [Dendroctonus ponderosae]|nr:hypothetical protein HUJ04_012535 [Dendroctonus ponderosae]
MIDKREDREAKGLKLANEDCVRENVPREDIAFSYVVVVENYGALHFSGNIMRVPEFLEKFLAFGYKNQHVTLRKVCRKVDDIDCTYTAGSGAVTLSLHPHDTSASSHEIFNTEQGYRDTGNIVLRAKWVRSRTSTIDPEWKLKNNESFKAKKAPTASCNFATLTVPPEFVEPIPNVTVALGRDASLPCVVKNLGTYKIYCLRYVLDLSQEHLRP